MADTTVTRPTPRPPARRFLAAIDPSVLIKDLTPRGLFGRSLIIVIAPMLLLQIVATFVFLDRHWEKVTRGLAYMAANDMALIMSLYDDLTGTRGYEAFASGPASACRQK